MPTLNTPPERPTEGDVYRAMTRAIYGHASSSIKD